LDRVELFLVDSCYWTRDKLRPDGPCHFSWGPVYTGPDKFVHGHKLAQFCLAFTRDRRNWTNFLTAKCASLRPEKSRSQTCTLSRSNIRPVPPVPCTRKVEPCKFLSVQKFVRTRVNVALVLKLPNITKGIFCMSEKSNFDTRVSLYLSWKQPFRSLFGNILWLKIMFSIKTIWIYKYGNLSGTQTGLCHS